MITGKMKISIKLKDMKCYVGMIVRGRPGDKCIPSLSFQEAIVNSVKEEPFDGGKYVTLDTSLGEFNQLIRDGRDYAMIPFYGNCPYTAKNIQMCTLADDKEKAIAILDGAFKTLLTDIQMALYPVIETK